MFPKDFDQLVKENFDLTDRDTRRTIISLDEADQNQLLAALTSKLYDKIVEKVNDIDFGTIPRSRGDITKIENYKSMMECVDILRSIIVEYKEDTYPIDVVSSAVENLKLRTRVFSKAYALNIELAVITYNTIALAIVSSVSFLISGCIEYIKDPGAETYTIALDKVGYKKTAQNMLFENLAKFNESCKSGEMDKALNELTKNNRKVSEDTHEDIPEEDKDKDVVLDSDKVVNEVAPAIIAGTKAALVIGGVIVGSKVIIAIAKVIIPVIQNLVYYFYQSKQNLSDYLAIQSELLQMNAYKVQYSTDLDPAKRKDTYNKQMKIANKMKDWSNKLDIDYSTSVKKATALSREEQKKYKTSELGIAPPVSTSNSSLF